jgi:GntR family transcriptional regulator/MocR family aminotransferase
LYTFDDGFPDPRIAPIEELVREYRRFGKSRSPNRYLMYGPEQGSDRLRHELANFLNRTRGMQVTDKEILVTKGTQMAIYLTTQLLICPGDTVFVPEPGYFDANQKVPQGLSRAVGKYLPIAAGAAGRIFDV